MRVSVVSCGIGNVQSVVNACIRVGAEPLVAHNADELVSQKSERIILPGVGAIGDALTKLRSGGIDKALASRVWQDGVPFLGICVGMQVMAESCEEFGQHRGLGWIPGNVGRIAPEDSDIRVPHVGWNTARAAAADPLFADVDGEHFYFVHSFAVACPDEFALARTDYAGSFVSAVRRDHAVGVQFHPEKSSRAGERLLANFLGA